MSTREIHLSCSCNYMEPDVSFNRTNGDHIIRLVDQEKESSKKENNLDDGLTILISIPWRLASSVE